MSQLLLCLSQLDFEGRWSIGEGWTFGSVTEWLCLNDKEQVKRELILNVVSECHIENVGYMNNVFEAEF